MAPALPTTNLASTCFIRLPLGFFAAPSTVPTADGPARVEPIRVVQPPGMRREVTGQLGQRRVAGQFGGFDQRRADVIAQASPTVGEQQRPCSSQVLAAASFSPKRILAASEMYPAAW